MTISIKSREGNDLKRMKRILLHIFSPEVLAPAHLQCISKPLGREIPLLIKLITNFQDEVDKVINLPGVKFT